MPASARVARVGLSLAVTLALAPAAEAQQGSACNILGVDQGSYQNECPGLTGWHASIDNSHFDSATTCNVRVQTSEYPGSNCAGYCA